MKNALTILLLALGMSVKGQDATLQQYLDKGDLFALRDAMKRHPSPPQSAEALYYGSFVDNAFNRNDEAIRKANSFLTGKGGQWTAQQVLRLEEMLMDAFVKTQRYADAAELSEIIVAKYPKDARNGILNAGKIWTALKDMPRQTVSVSAGSSVPMERNVIGLWEIPVLFGGRNEKFIFDTGANLSTISESSADNLKMRRIPVPINVSGGQGKKIRSQLAIADSLAIGNTLFRNVVFIVMPDKALDFPQTDFRISGIIGYPVIAAMKEVHITKDRLNIPLQTSGRSFSNLAMSGLTPLVFTVSGKDTMIFRFDTGALFTHLFSNYLEAHRESDKIRKADDIKMMSAGGGKTMKVYELSRLPLTIGDDQARLANVKIYTREVHDAGKGIVQGNMGQDVIAQFDEMVLNFEHMYLDFR